MSSTAAGVLFAASLALVLVHRPFGDYMYRVVTGTRHSRFERGVYRLIGVNPAAEQQWTVYARSVLAFSAVSILFLYTFQRVQAHLLLSLGFDNVPPDLSWNTAVSFITNTNWQAYSGESSRVTVGHAGDERAEADVPCDTCGVGERRVALEHLVLRRADHGDLEEVVHDPEAGHAGVVGVAGDPGERGADARRGARPGEVGDL